MSGSLAVPVDRFYDFRMHIQFFVCKHLRRKVRLSRPIPCMKYCVVAFECEATMLGWRTAFQGFDVCDFAAVTITILGFVAMLSAYLPGG